MSKNAVKLDEGEEALELRGSDGKGRSKNSTRRQRQRRTRFSRGKIIAVAALCCIILVLICAWFFYASLSNGGEHQEWIETIPGLHHHPKSRENEGSIISFRAGDPSSYEPWIEVIEEFLKDYNITEENEEYITKCDYDMSRNSSQACAVDVETFGHCKRENNFGYDKGTPCIFLRFNKILDWIPEFYNDTNDLPEEMPNDLKFSINNSSLNLNSVWVSCGGQTSADKELMGPLQYWPLPGFPAYYFPYDNSKHFMSPSVALFFERPQGGVIISVECRLWAPNIKYDQEKGSGFVRFELLID